MKLFDLDDQNRAHSVADMDVCDHPIVNLELKDKGSRLRISGMSSYLHIAEQVLRMAREPLSSREILKRAYLLDLMPYHLFGKTQHKTLGARLSIDILKNRDLSLFFRTSPGKYFLTEFISDDSIPPEYRVPLIARRRTRDLKKDRILSIDTALVDTSCGVCTASVSEAISSRKYTYLAKGDRRERFAKISSYFLFVRDEKVLTYRVGRYREGRDTFLNKRSVGFSSEVSEYDKSLFDNNDAGLTSAGLKVLTEDLDLPEAVLKEAESNRMAVSTYLCVKDGPVVTDVLGVVRFQCPEWFEPLKRRLALNEPEWVALDYKINHIEDYDPWSRVVISAYCDGLVR